MSAPNTSAIRLSVPVSTAIPRNRLVQWPRKAHYQRLGEKSLYVDSPSRVQYEFSQKISLAPGCWGFHSLTQTCENTQMWFRLGFPS